MDLTPLVQKLGVLSTNLAGTTSIRERVSIADRIFSVLGDIEGQVEQFVVNELGQVRTAVPSTVSVSKDRFRGMTIAEGGRMLLREHGQLHGKEIERLLKEGGLQSRAEHFQSTIFVAFRRDGGFQNIGGNNWRLKEDRTETSNGTPIPQMKMRHGAVV